MTDKNRLSIKNIVDRELIYIRSRRAAIASEIANEKKKAIDRESEPTESDTQKTAKFDTDDSSSTSAGSQIQTTKDLTPFNLGTVGLALSGGGIRSASFNLGVLQALARQKLLSNVDYLSTVSGGGYIGSWLSAWMFRDGSTVNVEKLIVPHREVNATAERGSDKDYGQSFDSEPEPIRHLRENTNFLAPTPGVLSSDSWTLLAIYLRNMFLNSCVVLPTLVGIQLTAMALMQLYASEEGPNPSITPKFFAIIGTLLLIGIFTIFWTSLSSTRARTSNGASEFGFQEFGTLNSFALPVLLLVAACYCFSVYVAAGNVMVHYLLSWCMEIFGFSKLQEFPQQLDWRYVVALSLFAGGLHTLSNLKSYQQFFSTATSIADRIRSIQWIFSGFLAGFTLLCLCLASFYAVESLTKFVDAEWVNCLQLTIVVPLLLCSYFIAESVQIGILGRLELAEVREKWSYLHAQSFIASVAWFATFMHACVLPSLIESLVLANWNQMIAPGTLWAIVSGVSLWLAQSQHSGLRNARWIDVLIKIGPVVFLSGAFLAIAICTNLFVGGIGGNRVSSSVLFASALVAFLLGFLASTVVDVNVFSLQELYQNRLVRAFLGASRPKQNQKGAPFRSSGVVRSPDPITHIDSGDDIRLHQLAFDSPIQTSKSTGQPLHLINTAINLQGENELERQERQADSFTFSPLSCGCPRTGYVLTSDGYANQVTLGTAFAISGAAVSPNMGYYSSPAVTALLTFFNLRLGAWMPNPAGGSVEKSGPTLGWMQLLSETLGWTTSKSDFVYLSDGGHFDNLGVYELLHRRCRYIISCDGGADPNGACHELAMIVRKAFIDFGIAIEIDLNSLAVDPNTGLAKSRVAVGKIYYPERNLMESKEIGYLIYIKSSIDGSEPSDIQSYRQLNPAFPHQSTVDQFFSESQFESYRHLGYHIANRFFSRNQAEFVDGHPMKRPTYPRKPIEVQRYFDYIMAIESMSVGNSWLQLEHQFGQEHAVLEKELRVNPLLAKLNQEVNCLTKVLDLREQQRFNSKLRKESKLVDKESTHFWKAFKESRTLEERRAEMGWAVQAIRTLDNVFKAIKLDGYHNSLSRGWMRVARRWMLNSSFDSVWDGVRCDYNVQLNEFVKNLKADTSWNPSKDEG